MVFGVIGLGVIGWVLSLLSDFSQKKVQHLMEKVAFPESSSDPYVIVLSQYNCLSFIPGCERVSHKSPHFEKNLNPVWEDMEVWSIAHSLFAKDVVIQVRDWDDNNFDDLIGEVVIDPQTQIAAEWTLYDLPLTKVEDKSANPNIQLEMKFTEETQVLDIKLISCTNLPIMDDYTGLLAQSVNNLKELVTALIILVCLLFGGALVFMFTEEDCQDWRYFDGLYFCYHTFTTIGYGDFSPASKIGRGLLIPYAFMAVGIGGYIIGLIQAGGISAGATAELPKNPDGSLKLHSKADEQEEAAWAIREALTEASSSDASSYSEYTFMTEEEQEELVLDIVTGEAELPQGVVLPRRRRKLLRGADRTFTSRARQYVWVEVDENGKEVPSPEKVAAARTLDDVYTSLYGVERAEHALAFDASYSTSSLFSEQEEEGDSDDKRYEVSATAQEDEAPAPSSGCIPASIKPSTYFGDGFGYRFGKQSFMAVAMVFIGAIMAPIEDWRFFEGIYAAVMTLTTVGYGDIIPAEDDGKIFLMFYSILGLAAVSGFFSLVSEASTSPPTDPELLRLENRLNKYRSRMSRFFHSDAMALIFYLALLITSIFVGAGVFANTMAFNPGAPSKYLDYIYFSTITLSTIGYGDISPVTDEGRAWFMFFILFGIAQLSHVLYLVQKIVGSVAERSLAEISGEDETGAGIDAIEQRSIDEGDAFLIEYLRTGKMDLSQAGASHNPGSMALDNV